MTDTSFCCQHSVQNGAQGNPTGQPIEGQSDQPTGPSDMPKPLAADYGSPAFLHGARRASTLFTQSLRDRAPVRPPEPTKDGAVKVPVTAKANELGGVLAGRAAQFIPQLQRNIDLSVHGEHRALPLDQP